VLHAAPPGHGFIQQFAHLFSENLFHRLFFAALKSPRRLALCPESSAAPARSMPANDAPFANIKAPDGFDLYAAGGHWHGAAVHDPPVDGRRRPAGHFYALNPRTRATSPPPSTPPGTGTTCAPSNAPAPRRSAWSRKKAAKPFMPATARKTFDAFKNKFGQTRARATGMTARAMQAHFLCLARNLPPLFERRMESGPGVASQAGQRRRRQRPAQQQQSARLRRREPPPLAAGCRRPTQTSLKLIRLLRPFYYTKLPPGRFPVLLSRSCAAL
jgi:hypothetical protein